MGLSNFTVMLPPKRADGSPVKGPLESAFLTKAMPLGLDMVIGSVKRNYELLAAGASGHGVPRRLPEARRIRRADAGAGVLCVMRLTACEAQRSASN